MNYPLCQYEELKKALVILKNHYKIDKDSALTHSSLLHLKVYQQKNYNYENLNVIKDSNGVRILELDESFKLYPENCNDTHVLTAMKKAINEIF